MFPPEAMALHPLSPVLFSSPARFESSRRLRCAAVALIVLGVSLSGAGRSDARETCLQGGRLSIVIRKADNALTLIAGGKPIKEFRVCLGMDPSGPKKMVGDKRTPEGDYFICMKQTGSRFHRFMGISYPNEKDARDAFEQGLIPLDTRNHIIRELHQGNPPPWHTRLGGWVGIHGYPTNDYQRLWVSLFFPKPHNWTDGCVALWNYEIEELFALLQVGAPVRIVP
jgi:murein L,D-transpeptidase YafK